MGLDFRKLFHSIKPWVSSCSRKHGFEAELPVPVWNVLAWDLCPLRVTRDACWPYPCHFVNTPVPPASTWPVLLSRNACRDHCLAQVWTRNEYQLALGWCPFRRVTRGLGLLGGASGPASVLALLGYFNRISTYKRGTGNFTSTEPKNWEEFDSKFSILRH